MWIRCKVHRTVGAFEVTMKDGKAVTFRRYPNVGVFLAHVPTQTYQRLLLGAPELYEPWDGPDPTDHPTAPEVTQGVILAGAASVPAQPPGPASGAPDPSAPATAGSLSQMSDDELRAFAREKGLTLPGNMKRDNAERRVLEFLDLKHEQDLEALGAGNPAPPAQ